MSWSHIRFAPAAVVFMAFLPAVGIAHAQRGAESGVVPFKIQVPDTALTDLKRRLAQGRFADELADQGGTTAQSSRVVSHPSLGCRIFGWRSTLSC
jgi:hypothetical protein